MWDSSPQFGRDFEMVMVCSIERKNIRRMFQDFTMLSHIWTVGADELEVEGAGAFGDERLRQVELDYMSSFRSGLCWHALPAVCVGFGASSFPRKFAALMHAIRLETFTCQAAADWTRSVCSVASDYGTENLLNYVDAVDAHEVLGCFDDTLPEDIALLVGLQPAADGGEALGGAAGEVDPAVFEEVPDVPDDVDAFENVPAPPMLDFSGMLGIAGLHHVIDNATMGFGDVMDKYTENVHMAVQVCKLLRKRAHKPRLLARCFAHGIGPQLADDINKFKGWVNPSRWGSIAFSIPEIIAVKGALRWGWNRERFLSGEDDGNGGAAAQEVTATLVNDVTAAVESPDWWAWLAMLEQLCCILRQCISWAEGCSCHYALLHDPAVLVDEDLRKQWLACPMRGLRAAELSAGDFLQLLARLSELTAAHLVVQLPPDINAGSRRSLLQEFDAARAHLSFYFVVKLSHLNQFPWKILQLSHADELVAQTALRSALASDHPHPRLQTLRGPLRQQCLAWLTGADIFSDELVDLCTFVGEMRFIPTSERPIEGQHAKTHKQGLGRPNHSEHYQSYHLRAPELARDLEALPENLKRFAAFAQCARNHRCACRAVGLLNHPAITQRAHAPKSLKRDPLLSQVGG